MPNRTDHLPALLLHVERFAKDWQEMLEDDGHGVSIAPQYVPDDTASDEVHLEHCRRMLDAAGVILAAVESVAIDTGRPLRLEFPVTHPNGIRGWGLTYADGQEDDR